MEESAQKLCLECRFWRGACEKGKKNRTAWDLACELFEAKTKRLC